MAIGYTSKATNNAAAVGDYSTAEAGSYVDYGAAFGTWSYATKGSVALGGAAGAYPPHDATNNVIIGYMAQASAPNTVTIGPHVSNSVPASVLIAVGPNLRFCISESDTNYVYLLNADGTTNGKMAWTR